MGPFVLEGCLASIKHLYRIRVTGLESVILNFILNCEVQRKAAIGRELTVLQDRNIFFIPTVQFLFTGEALHVVWRCGRRLKEEPGASKLYVQSAQIAEQQHLLTSTGPGDLCGHFAPFTPFAFEFLLLDPA